MKSALKVTLSLDACAYYIISLKMQENFNLAHISSKTKHNMLKLMIYNDCERE